MTNRQRQPKIRAEITLDKIEGLANANLGDQFIHPVCHVFKRCVEIFNEGRVTITGQIGREKAITRLHL